MAAELIVGIGGDGSGTAAALTAARIASLMNAKVVLVFGYDPTSIGPRGGSLEEEILAVGQRAVETVRAELAAAFPGVEIESEFVKDHAVEALMRVAADRHAEVIAVGHGGGGPLRGALLGSTTYELVHRATLPVLVVPDA
ncbi:MAG TPA: universal stress protein [Ilumatobacteraceae bacterium]|jgi:nucleotide-binding universal stress UspA family protein|nr:universal stress protein [Ilumatobacteraceae bacterium]